MLSDVQYQNITPIVTLISEVKESFPVLKNYPNYIMKEEFKTSEHDTNSFLFTKTLVIMIDWIMVTLAKAELSSTITGIEYI